MSEHAESFCPECAEHVEQPQALDRRNFIRVLGGSAAALTLTPALRAADAPKAKADLTSTASAKPSEEMVKELFSTLSEDQRTKIVLPFDHGGKGIPTRLGMYNGPINGKRIGDNYTKAQQELIQRTLRSLCADENAWRQISRNGTWDGSHSFEGCGCMLFGDPKNGKYAWVFSGHHLTIRCDGHSEPGAAFGGPIYYGHSPNGYDQRNVFNYQTRSVMSVYDALSETQRKMAVVKGSPGEQAPSVRFKNGVQTRPGIPYSFLSKDQRDLVEKVMRDVLSPYRKEDVEEVMRVIKATGGMEKIQLAFYHDGPVGDKQNWTFWRLEGQGFVWNYRVLPHVHTFVNISSNV